MNTDNKLVDALREIQVVAVDADLRATTHRAALETISRKAREVLAEHAASLAAPPASEAKAAIDTLKKLGYTYHGGVLWKPPLGPRPVFEEELAQQQEASGNDS